MEASRRVLLDPKSKRFAVEEVQCTQGFSLKVARQFQVLSERDLRLALGVPRLTKRHTDPLTSMSIPSEDDPTVMENIYFFNDPKAPHRTATLEQHIAGERIKHKMQAERHLWEDQSLPELLRLIQQDTQLGVCADLVDRNRKGSLIDLRVYLARNGIASSSNPHGDGPGGARHGHEGDGEGIQQDGASEGESEGEGIVGPAACLLHSSPGAPTDTPKKSRPLVPNFAASSSPRIRLARKSSFQPCAASLASEHAGASSVVIDDDDDDDRRTGTADDESMAEYGEGDSG